MSRELAPSVMQRITTRCGGTVEREETAAASCQLNAYVPVFSRAYKRRCRRRKHVVKSNGRQKLLASGRVRRLLKKGSGSQLQTGSTENGGAPSAVLLQVFLMQHQHGPVPSPVRQAREHSDADVLNPGREHAFIGVQAVFEVCLLGPAGMQHGVSRLVVGFLPEHRPAQPRVDQAAVIAFFQCLGTDSDETATMTV